MVLILPVLLVVVALTHYPGLAIDPIIPRLLKLDLVELGLLLPPLSHNLLETVSRPLLHSGIVLYRLPNSPLRPVRILLELALVFQNLVPQLLLLQVAAFCAHVQNPVGQPNVLGWFLWQSLHFRLRVPVRYPV